MNQGKMTALNRLVTSEYSNIAGLAVLKDGHTLLESYYNGCNAASKIHVFSVTKSIISILIGIARDKGCIKDLDQKVLDFFPEYEVKKRENTIQHITIKNLLTMTAPYKYKYNPYTKYFTSTDWVKFALDLLGGKGQVGEFRYAPLIGPDILSGILAQATGQSVFDFAQENLFIPLGITVEKNITIQSKEELFAFYEATDSSGWVTDARGIQAAGWGLTLTPVEMAKIGQLYLAGGKWENKQIVSQKWIAESTKEHSRWDAKKLPYGYLWWIYQDGFAAMGDGGNTIYVNQQKNIVISIASSFMPRAKDRMELIQKHIEPLV